MSSQFLIDTNVPSEISRPLPDPRVAAWLAAHDNLYLSVISIGEIQRGFQLLQPGRRRAQLEQWYENVLRPLVANSILPVTEAIAKRWGLLDAQRQSEGRPLSVSDGLIAATAFEHGLTLVTRNVTDFGELGLQLLNPFSGENTVKQRS